MIKRSLYCCSFASGVALLFFDSHKMSAFASQGINITSNDIDASKFTKASLDRMRTAFPGQNDTALARFLIARNDDVGKATELLSAHLAWRSEHLPIFKSSCMNELVKAKLYNHGFDKEGHPLVIWKTSRNIAKERDIKEMGDMIIWWLEYLEANSPADKSKVTILMDRSGYTQANSDLEFIKSFSKVLQVRSNFDIFFISPITLSCHNCVTTYFQDNYPEKVYRVIVYPSGIVFYGIWNIVKFFLDPVTQVSVCNRNKFVVSFPRGYCYSPFCADDQENYKQLTRSPTI